MGDLGSMGPLESTYTLGTEDSPENSLRMKTVDFESLTLRSGVVGGWRPGIYIFNIYSG